MLRFTIAMKLLTSYPQLLLVAVEHWYQVENRCYFFGDHHVGLSDAEANCAKVKARLPILKTPEENNQFRNFIFTSGNNRRLWLGHRKNTATGEWITDDDDTAADFGFGFGQPSGGGENCMNWQNYGSNGCWNDIPCTGVTDVYTICEIGTNEYESNIPKALLRLWHKPDTYIVTTSKFYPTNNQYTLLDPALSNVYAATIYKPTYTEPLYEVKFNGKSIMATDKEWKVLSSKANTRMIKILAYLPLSTVTWETLVPGVLMWNDAQNPTNSIVHTQGFAEYTYLVDNGWVVKSDIFFFQAPEIEEFLSSMGTSVQELNEELARSTTITDTLPFILANVPQNISTQLFNDINSTIVHCELNGQQCDMNKWKTVGNPKYGSCFVFNYAGGMESTFGSSRGLQLTLDMNEGEYTCNSESSGFVLQLHDPNETALPEVFGYSISPGFHTLVSIAKTSIKKLGYPYSNCITSVIDGQPYFYDGIYVNELCIRSCFQNYLIGKCGCADPRYAKPEIAQYCSPGQKKCLDNIIMCEQDLIQHLGCNCPDNCENTLYDVTFTTSALQTKFQKASANSTELDAPRQRRKYASIHLTYASAKTMSYQETAAYEPIQFASDIINIFETLYGCGIVIILELLVFGCGIIQLLFHKSG